MLRSTLKFKVGENLRSRHVFIGEGKKYCREAVLKTCIKHLGPFMLHTSLTYPGLNFDFEESLFKQYPAAMQYYCEKIPNVRMSGVFMAEEIGCKYYTHDHDRSLYELFPDKLSLIWMDMLGGYFKSRVEALKLIGSRDLLHKHSIFATTFSHRSSAGEGLDIFKKYQKYYKPITRDKYECSARAHLATQMEFVQTKGVGIVPIRVIIHRDKKVSMYTCIYRRSPRRIKQSAVMRASYFNAIHPN